MNRVEHYLARLMNNPDRWIRVTKLKYQRPSTENTAERVQVMQQIKSALDLMGIKYECKDRTHFTIKIVPDPKNLGYTLHTNYEASSEFRGMRPKLIVIDDMVEA